MPNYTILLVDYEPRSVERSRRPLTDAGFKVHLAPDGVAALEAFERLKPDLVLIEAMLPKKNGFEVCQELRRTPNGKSTPILITTAVYKGRKYRSQALHVHGADEYIEKPIADDQLIAMIRRFLKSSTKRPAQPSEALPGESTESSPSLAGKPVVESAAPRASRLTPTPAPAPAAAPTPSTTAVLVAASPDPAAATAGPGLTASAPGPATSSSWRAAANALIGGLTEDEISARLDELLPNSLTDVGTSSGNAQEAAAAPDSFDLEAAADVLAETDPEFDASQTTEPLLVPTVAEDATDLEAREPMALLPAKAPEADVVRFDTKRSKKRGKKGNVAAVTAERSATPAVERASTPAVERPTVAAVENRPAVVSPSLTAMSPENNEADVIAPRRRSSLWIWALVLIAVGVGIYFAVFHFGMWQSATSADTEPVGVAQRPSNPVPSIPASTLPTSPETTPPEENVVGDPSPMEPTASSPADVTDPPTEAPPAKPSRTASATARKDPPRSSASRTASSASSLNAGAAMPVPTQAPMPPSPEAPPRQVSAGETQLALDTGSGAKTARPEVTIVEPPLGIDAVPPHVATASSAAPKRPVREGDLLPLADADQPPVALNRPAPAYPRRARADGEQGDVDLSLLIDETGRVVDLRVINAENSDFGTAATKVARNWTYKPAMKDGVRVRVWKSERVIFRL